MNFMNKLKLNQQQQIELQNLWQDFKADFIKNETLDSQEIQGLLKQWHVYKEKILDETLTLEEYTNRLENAAHNLPGGYLCNFLERTTSKVFGSSKPGNAYNFEVKLNNDNETYSINHFKKNDSPTNHSFEDANKYFENDIKPLFNNICKSKDIITANELIESSEYTAKQILRKVAALDNPDQFIFIYRKTDIENLHSKFLATNTQGVLNQNNEIRLALESILSLDKDIFTSVILSRFLWKYLNTKDIVDDNSPNVILYGAPGTGKTFQIKQSLGFITQGDRSRYEFIQFHPSFTYEDFIEGIKPKGVTKDGNIKFELVNGIFKRFCIKAKNNPDKTYYFVIDEINRANLSSVFGETLVCLEKNYRHMVTEKSANTENLIKTQYSSLIEDMIKENEINMDLAYHYVDGDVYFGVPNNLYFIGMMNDVDKSIDTFDLALRRRFKWIRKDCDYDTIEEHLKLYANFSQYRDCCATLNKYISETLGLGKSFEFGHAFFMRITEIATTKKITVKNIRLLFELYLEPTLKEYMRSLYSENELDDKVKNAMFVFEKPMKGH